MSAIRMHAYASKAAAPAPRAFDPLSTDLRAATRPARKADEVPGLDPRITAISPALDTNAARLLDEIVSVYETQGSKGVKRGVNVAATEVMAVLGCDRETASTTRATLIVRGLIVSTNEDAMSGGEAYKPVLTALPKVG